MRDKKVADESLDCRWQLCPVPILMTEEKMAAMEAGRVLEVVYTDPGATPDLEAWCRTGGAELLGFREEKINRFAYLRKL